MAGSDYRVTDSWGWEEGRAALPWPGFTGSLCRALAMWPWRNALSLSLSLLAYETEPVPRVVAEVEWDS